MDHARPAQLIIAPSSAAGWRRGHTASAVLEVAADLVAVRAGAHVRGGRLDVALNRPDVRPSRAQAHPPSTVAAGSHYHYFRQTRYGR